MGKGYYGKKSGTKFYTKYYANGTKLTVSAESYKSLLDTIKRSGEDVTKTKREYAKEQEEYYKVNPGRKSKRKR